MNAFISAIIVAVVMAGGAGYYLQNVVDKNAAAAYATTGVRL